jgi:hypothetical protein
LDGTLEWALIQIWYITRFIIQGTAVPAGIIVPQRFLAFAKFVHENVRTIKNEDRVENQSNQQGDNRS